MRNTILAVAATAALALPAAAQRVGPSAPDSAAGGVTAQAATTTPTAARPAMSEAAIRDHLRGLGYTGIEGLERRGDAGGAFHIREARRWGERVENLTVDAATGDVADARPMSERQIRTMPREIGWTNIGEVRAEGQYVRVRAERNGREHDLRIDPRVGILDQPGAGR
jgi:hypothetical protein